MSKIKVFYDERQSVESSTSFSPSAQKPKQVVAYWGAQGHPIELTSFAPATANDISLVHNPKYVEGVLNCTTANGFGNRNRDVAAALPWVVGSMVNSALYAYQSKDSCFSPTSGAHHAHYSGGGGFCTFNHLVLAAVKAHQSGAKKIGIIDLDCHYGDGTEDIIRHLKLDYIEHYTFGGDSPRPGDAADLWLTQLSSKFNKMKDCDLLIYNAGADPHVDDPLGGKLSTEQMFIRDLIVYEFARDNNIPVTTSLAGGYQRDKSGSIEPVLKLHNQTMMAFRDIFLR